MSQIIAFALIFFPILAFGEAPKIILPGEQPSSNLLFDLDRLSPQSKTCGIGVISNADLDAVTTELERKSLRWLVGLSALSEQHEQIRHSETLRFKREIQNGLVDQLANFSVHVHEIGEGGGSSLGVLVAIIDAALAATLHDSTKGTTSKALKILPHIMLGAAPVIAFGGSALHSSGHLSAERLRFSLAKTELTLDQERTWIAALENKAVVPQVEILAKVFGWDSAERDQFTAALRNHVLKNTTNEFGPRTFAPDYPNTSKERAILLTLGSLNSERRDRRCNC